MGLICFISLSSGNLLQHLSIPKVVLASLKFILGTVLLVYSENHLKNQFVAAIMENSTDIPQKLKPKLLHGLKTPLLGIYF